MVKNKGWGWKQVVHPNSWVLKPPIFQGPLLMKDMM